MDASGTQDARRERVWAVALAAGDGLRLRRMTTAHDGIAVPKQFCSLWGDRTLLETTLARAQRVAARERICTVVAAQHRQWWHALMWPMRSSNTIVHPVNRGTGVGVLQALLHILHRAPEALIVLLPSDHHVEQEPILARAIQSALAYASAHDDAVVLLGFKPEEVDPELGYIVPGPADDSGMLAVAEFVEKPSPVRAGSLVLRGALWNAFIVAASGRALLDLYARRHGGAVKAMRELMSCDAIGFDGDYARHADTVAGFGALPTINFSSEVLHGAEARLRVMPVPCCGWIDLGTPRTLAKAVGRAYSDAAAPAGPQHRSTAINLSQRCQQLAGNGAQM